MKPVYWEGEAEGYVSGIDALSIGKSSVELGAGRKSAHEPIDLEVGFEKLLKRGEKLSRGCVVGVVHARDPLSLEKAARSLSAAIACSPSPLTDQPRVVEIIRHED